MSVHPAPRRADAAANRVDFTRPQGEAALIAADSVSWRVFKNPVATFIGGVTAVILELAEPRVRAGVWDHTTFRVDPRARLRRTGLAAMVTVYGARSTAEAMIRGVRRMHARVEGTTEQGIPYRASDPALLDWVQSTASFGFVEAYARFAQPLTDTEFDRFYQEAAVPARLYGCVRPPRSRAEQQALFEQMSAHLTASPVIFEFLRLMRQVHIFPALLRPFQRMLVRAAIEVVPDWARQRVGLDASWGLRGWEAALVRMAGRIADGIALSGAPAVQACERLGMPRSYLYRPQSR